MDHTLQFPVITRRRILKAVLFFGSSALVAFGLAAGLREYLPYEGLRRFTEEERFMAWEGALWMLGLVMVFFGGAGAIGTLHLLRLGFPAPEEIRNFARDMRPPKPAFSLGPYWMISTGALLLAIAIVARAQLPG